MSIKDPFLDKELNRRELDAVNSSCAAAALGISRKTLGRLRRLGVIPAFSLPSRISGRRMWRFRLQDLLTFKEQQRVHVHVWDPYPDLDLPVIVVARLLGCTIDNVYAQRHRGRLKDYRAETVRRYLVKLSGERLRRQIRKESASGLSEMRSEGRRLRQILNARLGPDARPDNR